MKPMPWFRMFNEARTDAKLALLSDAQFRVWFRLLCLASDQTEQRGSVPALDPFILAVEVAGGDEELLRETLELLGRLQMVEQIDGAIRFISFEKRQYDKPSDTPEATQARKDRQRDAELSRAPEPLSRDVTPGHALSRAVTPGHALSRDVTPGHALSRAVTHKSKSKTETETKSSVLTDGSAIADAAVDFSDVPFEPALDPRPKPWDLFEVLCEEAEIEPIMIQGKARDRQLAAGKRLLQAGAQEQDIRSCFQWLRGQAWVNGAVDLELIDRQWGKWVLAGKPTAPPSNQPNGRASPEDIPARGTEQLKHFEDAERYRLGMSTRPTWDGTDGRGNQVRRETGPTDGTEPPEAAAPAVPAGGGGGRGPASPAQPGSRASPVGVAAH